MKRSILICLLFPLVSVAQPLPDYFVDLVKGPVIVQGTDKKTKPVKPLMLLYNNDIVIIKSAGSEITIVNRSDQYIILNVPGSYKISDLQKSLVKESEGVMHKYLHLVWEELLHSGKDYSTFKAKNMGSWGGVIRGSCTKIEYPYLNMVLGSDSIPFAWKPDAAGITYELSIKDAGGSVIKKMQLKDTIVILPANELFKGNERSFFWTVQNLNNPCTTPTEYKFTLMGNAAYAVRVKEISKVIPQKESKAQYYLKVAEALNQRGFYDAAAAYIGKAVDVKK